MTTSDITYTGDEITVTGQFDIDDILTDPTAVTASVLSPDGTTTTPTPTKTSTGVYEITVTVDTPGRWFFTMVGTGTVKKRLYTHHDVIKTPFD